MAKAKKIDSRTINRLADDALKLIKEEGDELDEKMIYTALRSGLVKGKGKKLMLAGASVKPVPGAKMPSKAEVKAFLSDLEDKIKDFVCTDEVKEYLNKSEFKDALKIIIQALLTALAVVAPAPAVMLLVIAAAAYLVKRGCYLMCGWA